MSSNKGARVTSVETPVNRRSAIRQLKDYHVTPVKKTKHLSLETVSTHECDGGCWVTRTRNLHGQRVFFVQGECGDANGNRNNPNQPWREALNSRPMPEFEKTF